MLWIKGSQTMKFGNNFRNVLAGKILKNWLAGETSLVRHQTVRFNTNKINLRKCLQFLKFYLKNFKSIPKCYFCRSFGIWFKESKMTVKLLKKFTYFWKVKIISNENIHGFTTSILALIQFEQHAVKIVRSLNINPLIVLALNELKGFKII